MEVIVAQAAVRPKWLSKQTGPPGLNICIFGIQKVDLVHCVRNFLVAAFPPASPNETNYFGAYEWDS